MFSYEHSLLSGRNVKIFIIFSMILKTFILVEYFSHVFAYILCYFECEIQTKVSFILFYVSLNLKHITYEN